MLSNTFSHSVVHIYAAHKMENIILTRIKSSQMSNLACKHISPPHMISNTRRKNNLLSSVINAANISKKSSESKKTKIISNKMKISIKRGTHKWIHKHVKKKSYWEIYFSDNGNLRIQELKQRHEINIFRNIRTLAEADKIPVENLLVLP